MRGAFARYFSRTRAPLLTLSDQLQASKGINMAVTLDDQQVRLSAKGQRAIRELRKLRAERDELAEKIKKHEETLKADIGEPLIGGKYVGIVAGVPVCSYTMSVRRTVNQTLLRKAYPDVYEECATESLVPLFKVLGEK